MPDGFTVSFALPAGFSGAVGFAGIIATAGPAQIAAGPIAAALAKGPGAWLDLMMRNEFPASQRADWPAVVRGGHLGGFGGIRLRQRSPRRHESAA
jgi:hypothetical protein